MVVTRHRALIVGLLGLGLAACSTESTAPQIEDTWISTSQASGGAIQKTDRAVTFAGGRFDSRSRIVANVAGATVTTDECSEGSYTLSEGLLTMVTERRFALDEARIGKWKTDTRTITGKVDFPNADTLRFAPSDGSETLLLKRGVRPDALECR